MNEAEPKHGRLPGLLAAAIAIAVYAATLGHRFADDDAEILRSPLLSRPWDLRAVFTGGFYSRYEPSFGVFRPLAQWSLLLNAALSESPALFHAVNVLLHAAASYLVFAWLVRLPVPRWVAGATAVLWAVLPVGAEVAAHVSARDQSLAVVFGLGFLIAHRSRRAVLAALLLLAALLCHPSALAFLPLALAVDALWPSDGRRFEARSAVACGLALIAWFLLRCFAPSSHSSAAITPVRSFLLSLTSDPYAPSIFPCLLAALALSRLPSRRVANVVLVAVAGCLATLSFARASVWKDDSTLFRDQVKRSPASAKAHANLAGVLALERKFPEAVAEYQKSLEIDPEQSEALFGLGHAYEALGGLDPELLLDTWVDSIRLGPRGEEAIVKELLAAVDLGDWPEVFDARGQIVAADPEDPILIRIDRILHAAQDLSDVPMSGEDWARANVLFKLGDYAEAEAKYRRTLHHRDLPGNEVGNTLLNMAACDEKLNRPARAEHFRRLAAAWSAKKR